MERRRVRALRAATVFVPGFGQVHFNPDSDDFDVRNPSFPPAKIVQLVADGWVADDVEAEQFHHDPRDLDALFEANADVAEILAETPIADLRKGYEALVGRKPFGGWDAATLLAKMDAFEAAQQSEGSALFDSEGDAPA